MVSRHRRLGPYVDLQGLIFGVDVQDLMCTRIVQFWDTFAHQNGIVTSNHVKVNQDSWVWKEVGTFPKTCKYSQLP